MLRKRKRVKKIKILFWKCEKECFIFASAFGRKAAEKKTETHIISLNFSQFIEDQTKESKS